MKKTAISRILSLLVMLCMIGTMAMSAFAATAETATIDTTKTGSITINKYDMTEATKDGVFETNSFVSTGSANDTAESILADYAIQGVIFSYIKVADIVTYSAQEADGYKVMNLYAFDEGAATTQLLTALGLTADDAYDNVEAEEGKLYFVSDTLINALAAKLQENSSVLKNALEQFMADQDGIEMPETNAAGQSSVSGLELGLYLLVETYVPENVFKTTAPFFVSVPMTTIDGADWNYDLVLYPKNETDEPTLEKTLRENADDTGKHNGTTDDITDGYAHTGTGSDGDVVDYQIISTLPAITSNATALTTYTFEDILSKGIEYNKGDVKLEWFKDAACTELVATWTEDSGKFAVTYGAVDNDTTMTITMTADGLDEINNASTVYNADSLFRGYSSCTVRITYSCTVNSSADTVYGDDGNPNTATLTWKRTNTAYYDTLTDDCHFYVYGLDLLKQFSDNLGNFANVNFVIRNETDGYWVVAEQDAETGIYYVTDHVDAEEDATVFVPTEDGKVIVKGLEDDAYVITETHTDANYVLRKDAIRVVITANVDEEICTVCGESRLTATATVNGDSYDMAEDNGSVNAIVPLIVINERGWDIPVTGDAGTMMLAICGTLLMFSAMFISVIVFKMKRNKQ